ncbi:hypothetical protein [Flavobacterium quisquiliarum]|uniref:Uncharacterized protein n=1 Tax=Flavobacterium quisquiliarum TaxID=1834436 RepID=A0ABV8WFV2_9FLAO|nr:hypothetical protein [Flavobacterium quisquiliarum]MBW1658716.1 hypothetical protein [Flavobacterium quisquiliarum]NWL03447.1 hypothetical protein [Flavobacterium collinsii]
MGYWCSLHLFDDKKFYSKVVPELKGEIGDLTEACREFLKYYLVGGISRFSEGEINSLIEENIRKIVFISNSLDESFKIHHEFHKINNYDAQISFIGKLDGHYEFCKFLEYYIFKTCADYNPHLGLGKGGVFRNFNIPMKTLSCDIIGELDNWNDFLSQDRMGIANWITYEDVELLFYDKENLHFEDNERADTFLELLDVAYKNKLGFIVGIDMRETQLELLYENKLLKI